jgi:hypothetical protein
VALRKNGTSVGVGVAVGGGVGDGVGDAVTVVVAVGVADGENALTIEHPASPRRTGTVRTKVDIERSFILPLTMSSFPDNYIR